MKRSIFYLLAAVAMFFSCEPVPMPDNDDTGNGEGNTEVPDESKSVISWSPEEPDADKGLTITFKAGTSSKLYDYKGDVYAHIGVLEYGIWKHVQAEWNENIDKCRFTPSEDKDNEWTLTLKPSIREYFQSGEMPLTQIGIVIRSSDGQKKGIEEDSFIPVTDNKYKGFEPVGPESRQRPAGMQYGINIIDNSTVTFVLHDCDTEGKHRDYAYIIGDFNGWTLSNSEKSRMYRDDTSECWWITVSGLDASKEYRYQYHVGDFDGTSLRLGDTFSEKILDPDNDKYIPSTIYNEDISYPDKGVGIVSVLKIAKDGYVWEVPEFTIPEDLMVYELLFRDFTSTGDIKGAIEKLDYLKALGVNAIELMPIQEFDGNDSWGYNPCYYFALDKAYGTEEAYKQFVDECHKRGMAVIIDVVYNHNTGNSPLARLYWDGQNNRTSPNNPYFNVTAPHPFSVFHDFNHENRFVKELVKRSTEYLLEEYNVDGFRFDLTKGFTQRQCSESTASSYDAGRIAILKDYCSAIKAIKSDAVVILEHFCDNKEEKELAEAGMTLWRNMNNAYCQTAMGWQESSGFSGLYSGTSMPSGSLVGFMESHDEERTCYKQIAYGNGNIKTDIGTRMQRAALNAAFFLTVPGPKMIWQFGEFGYDVSIEEGGRTGRKPLHWEYMDVPERKALYDTYAELIGFRSEYPEFFDESASFSWNVGTGDWSTGRSIVCTAGGKSFMVVGNFDTKANSITVSNVPDGTWKNFHDTAETYSASGGSVTFDNMEAAEYKLLVNF